MPNIVWYAAGGGIKKAGPYSSQVEAWQMMELTETEQMRQNAIHPCDTRVWPEYAKETHATLKVPCAYCEFTVVGTEEECKKIINAHCKDIHDMPARKR